MRVPVPEDDRGDCDQAERRDRGRLDSQPCRQETARDPADEDADGIRGRQQSRTGLAQVEALGVFGQERRKRGEEERVHEHDRAGEDEDAAHGALDYPSR